jgi:hypothetical protein
MTTEQPKEHVHGENCHHEHEKEEHVHGENCDHEHDDSSDDENTTDPTKKSNRGEKKFKKAMTKLGMKPVTGINRVTIRKGKSVRILTYFSSSSVLITLKSLNPLEPKTLMLSSENQTWMI